MKNLDFQTLFKPLITLFKRFHLTIFIVLLTAGLGFAVLSFSTLLAESANDSTYTSPIGAGTIDQANLQRINALHTSEAGAPNFTAPAGRINPLAE